MSRLLLLVAAAASAFDVALGVVAVVVVATYDDMGHILVGDMLMLLACLLAIPLLHYWIEGR